MRNFTVGFIVLLLTTAAQSQTWNYLNFECGGYVTEIIPVKYPSTVGKSIDNQVLYARTDIGGVYRSNNNGLSWTYVSTYLNYPTGGGHPGISGSELSIQGIAVRYDSITGKEIVNVAWGNYEDDAKSEYRSIWRSDNSGAEGSWTKPTIIGQVWFRGNNFPVKLGGPCITYDPNNIRREFSHMYMGGFGPTVANIPGKAYLYKSENDGQSWDLVQSFRDFQNVNGYAGEGITCINISKKINPSDTAHIWVGTTHGIVFTTNGGTNWQRVTIPGVPTPYVKRILLKKEGSIITGAMVTWGKNDDTTGVGRLLASGGWQYIDITSNFLTGYTGGSGSGLFSSLTFVDTNETIIISGKYERPLRKTGDFGNSWYGEVNNSPNNEVVFRYTQSGNNFPAHQQKGELDPSWGFMYDGLSCITKNPNSGWGNQWYLSGGAGARMTVSSAGADTNFVNSRWKYTTLGQAMTVNYDVVFSKVNNREAIYLPLSDWTMGSTYQDRLSTPTTGGFIQDTLSYDRQETRPLHLYDTYISNVTRILIHPDNPNISYCVGGSVYDFNPTESYRAGFYVRTDSNGIIKTSRKETHPFLQKNDRAIVDAIINNKPVGGNRIIVLAGRNRKAVQPGDSLGIFYSDDGGVNWGPRGTFNQQSGNQTMSTQQAYQRSIIPGLIDGAIGDIFDGHFHLVYLGNGRVGLWLEAGGMFISTDNGENWGSKSPPSQLTNKYLRAGSLKYVGNDTIALAVRKGDADPGGLYKGIIDSIGNIIWLNGGSSISNFTSAEHLDINLDRWVVYGKKDNDLYNQIYFSISGGNWQRIAPPAQQHLPRVKSLRIRPDKNEIWVASSGQGVWRYTYESSNYTKK
ncbi:MAG: hypothetical protein QME58_02355 [Bacteroidota bacterium]|nr:hypothetical protein [Bacteroidota bacterium]